jgi:hypothetical protein
MLKSAEGFVRERIAHFSVENRQKMLISLIDSRPNFNKFCNPDFDLNLQHLSYDQQPTRTDS